MKRLSTLFLAMLSTSHYVYAEQMTGFATQYYQEDTSLPQVESALPLFPVVTIGNKAISMETSYLTDIANTAVHKDDSASWICLHSQEGINYWFISGNEM